MPPRDWKVRIDDMLDAARRIQQYTLDMTAEEFEADQRTYDAVLRNLIVIGEAARYVPTDIGARYVGLPLIDIRGMRNFRVHQCDNLDVGIVWDTVKQDIERLITTLVLILEREP